MTLEKLKTKMENMNFEEFKNWHWPDDPDYQFIKKKPVDDAEWSEFLENEECYEGWQHSDICW